MKKIVLSTAIIVVFTSYALYRRMAEVVVPVPPVEVQVGSSSSSSLDIPPPPPQQASDASSVDAQSSDQASSVAQSQGQYKDGQYTGISADAIYGNVQVQVTVQNGRITDVQFLDHPHEHGNSVRINNFAMPKLSAEAIQAQSAPVDVVSGATATSGGFNQSFASALAQAQQ